jgi:hypothetical protein
MALFRVAKGLAENLPSTKTAGYCWYTYDDSKFYIDYEDENGELQRKALNAKDAETLMGASLATVLNSSEVEIPTSKAILDYLDAHTYDENDAMKLIAEMGLIEPTVDENGAVYIDENGVIYTL